MKKFGTVKKEKLSDITTTSVKYSFIVRQFQNLKQKTMKNGCRLFGKSNSWLNDLNAKLYTFSNAAN